MQIYGEFSGYTDMAIGSAHMLGYKLAPNFNMPYLSRNIAEFWRRWHISLSSWLRDYLFIPLGGSRDGRWHTCRNLLVTMTLGGLWHGAAWHFVVWGVIQGAWLSAHRLFRDFVTLRPRLDRSLQSSVGTVLCVSGTFLLVSLSWVVFRAPSLADAGLVLRRLFVPYSGEMGPPMHGIGLLYTVIVVAICHAVAMQPWLRRLPMRLPAPLTGAGYATAATLAIILAPASGKMFIYFQF